ncbi:Uncharacterized protein APZ42_000497 [Daphnia magna]|uniref:Uncharacterized protein n=1 Tax=Daphnia magna TaxID=35525 RepID=A0A164JLC6_9CRUS|nr:Uncharacterized protein APZ42_000497 [Daphnia magna]
MCYAQPDEYNSGDMSYVFLKSRYIKYPESYCINKRLLRAEETHNKRGNTNKSVNEVYNEKSIMAHTCWL